MVFARRRHLSRDARNKVVLGRAHIYQAVRVLVASVAIPRRVAARSVRTETFRHRSRVRERPPNQMLAR